jgi:lipopolysaccharide export system permease protein
MKIWDIQAYIIEYFKRLPRNTVESTVGMVKAVIHFVRHFSFTEYKTRVIAFIKRPLLPFKLYLMLIKSFAYWFVIAQGLFIVILIIFDLFSKLDEYMRVSVSVINILIITGLYVPKAIWLTMPVAIMFGIIMALGTFYQNNELVAIFTAGISIYKFVVPVVLINLFLSIFMIFGDSNIVIPTFRAREKLYKKATRGGTSSEKDNEDITIRGEDNIFWHARKFTASNNTLNQVVIFQINSGYRVIYRIDAASAVFTREGWLFRSGIVREWDNTGDMADEVKFHKRVFDLKETPDFFKKSEFDIEDMTIIEAGRRIKQLRKLNVEHNKELTQYYKKFAFPFTLIIVCLFAIGVSTISKKNVLILSLFFSIGLSIIYYVMQMVLEVLSNSGKLPPFVGAWFSIFIFLPISINIMRKAKT